MCSKFNRLCFPFIAPQQNCQVTKTAGLQHCRFGSIKETTVLWKPIKRFWEIALKQINHSRCQTENTYNKQNIDFKLQSGCLILTCKHTKKTVRFLKIKKYDKKLLVREKRSCKVHLASTQACIDLKHATNTQQCPQ